MDRAQLARECVEIEKEGCSVRDFLASRGCLSPWGTWYRLQKEELGRKEWQITEGKGAKEMRKLTLENKKRAVEIALEGGNPQEYLKSLEVANPSASWIYIKKCLKARDPAKYDELMKVTEKETAQEPEPEKEPKKAEESKKKEIVYKGCGNCEFIDSGYDEGPCESCNPTNGWAGWKEKIFPEEVKKPEEVVFQGKVYEKAEEEQPDEKPVAEKRNEIPDGFTIMSVGTPVGIFSRDKENIRFETESALIVTGTAEWWQKLAEMMPKVLQVLE